MTPLIGWVLAYVAVGELAVIVILLQMARPARRDLPVVLSIVVGWPAFFLAVVAHRLWSRFRSGRDGRPGPTSSGV